MNSDELNVWQDEVLTHCQVMNNLANDRSILKNLMTQHLQNYFDFDFIYFSSDFNKITLKWKYQNDPIVRDGCLDELGMDFIITHDYDKELGHGVVIEVYPFGIEED